MGAGSAPIARLANGIRTFSGKFVAESLVLQSNFQRRLCPKCERTKMRHLKVDGGRGVRMRRGLLAMLLSVVSAGRLR